MMLDEETIILDAEQFEDTPKCDRCPYPAENHAILRCCGKDGRLCTCCLITVRETWPANIRPICYSCKTPFPAGSRYDDCVLVRQL